MQLLAGYARDPGFRPELGDKLAIDSRCNELRKQIKDCTSDYDREKLEERLAKLAGGVAVIRVGALLATHLPGVPFTLSHALNPTIREFRRELVFGKPRA